MVSLAQSSPRTGGRTTGYHTSDDRFPTAFIAAIETAVLKRSGRQRRDEITFRCPMEGHEDCHPSARWHTHKAVWTCDVCNCGGGAIDLANLLGVPKPAGKQVKTGYRSSENIVATYDYQDPQGRLLYQVVRYEPKAFRQRRPDPEGAGWINNIQGVEPVLYRLPDLLNTDDMIVVVEGEKDADRLRTFDIVATTAPMGAGKWRDSYTELLAGREIVIIPDNDETGCRHAEAVATRLHAAGCVVQVVRLDGVREKGDVSDWLDLGFSDDDLVQLIRTTPLWTPAALSRDCHDDDHDDPTGLSSVTHTLEVCDSDSGNDGPERDNFVVESLVELLTAEIPEVEYVVDGLLTSGNSVLFSAREKTGKGLFFIDTAINVATGQPVLGRAVTPGPVLYVALEENRRLIRDRFRARVGQMKGEPVYTITGQTLDLAQSAQVERLRRAIELSQARLVVIDTLREAHDRNENHSDEMTPIARAIRLLAQETGACIAVTHHMSRAGGSRGSTSIPAGFPDTIEYYADDVPDKLSGVLSGKGRDVIGFTQRITFNPETNGWEVDVSGGKEKLTATEQAILDVLNATDEWLSSSEIAKRAGKSSGSVRNALSTMRRRPADLLRVKGDGRETRYHGLKARSGDDAITSTAEPPSQR